MLKVYFLSALIVVCGGYTDGLLSSELYKKYLKMRSLPYEDCGSMYSIVYLNLSSCSTIPCEMARGTNVLVQTIFNDNDNSIQFLKHSVRWIFNAIKTGATISPDPCNGQEDCISNETEGKSYWALVYVNNSLPVMRGTMLWEAADESNKMVICFKIPVIITLQA